MKKRRRHAYSKNNEDEKLRKAEAKKNNVDEDLYLNV